MGAESIAAETDWNGAFDGEQGRGATNEGLFSGRVVIVYIRIFCLHILFMYLIFVYILC